MACTCPNVGAAIQYSVACPVPAHKQSAVTAELQRARDALVLLEGSLAVAVDALAAGAAAAQGGAGAGVGAGNPPDMPALQKAVDDGHRFVAAKKREIALLTMALSQAAEVVGGDDVEAEEAVEEAEDEESAEAGGGGAQGALVRVVPPQGAADDDRGAEFQSFSDFVRNARGGDRPITGRRLKVVLEKTCLTLIMPGTPLAALVKIELASSFVRGEGVDVSRRYQRQDHIARLDAQAFDLIEQGDRAHLIEVLTNITFDADQDAAVRSNALSVGSALAKAWYRGARFVAFAERAVRTDPLYDDAPRKVRDAGDIGLCAVVSFFKEVGSALGLGGTRPSFVDNIMVAGVLPAHVSEPRLTKLAQAELKRRIAAAKKAKADHERAEREARRKREDRERRARDRAGGGGGGGGRKRQGVCFEWEKHGTCRFGNSCRYPHPKRKSERERRDRSRSRSRSRSRNRRR